MTTSSLRSAPSVESEPVDLSTPYSLARAVIARRPEYIRPHRIRVKIGSWNVAACPGTDKDLATWFLDEDEIDQDMPKLDVSETPAEEDYGAEKVRVMSGNKVGLYVLGLQEVVDLNLTKEYMTRTLYTDNTATQKWKTALEAAMPPKYQLVAAEQMFGILLLIYASPDVAPTITNVSTKQVGTGLGGWFANKGAVTTRLVLGETTRLVFVNCHLASGATTANLDRRCADAATIVSKTQLDPVVHAGVEEDEGEAIGDEDFAFWFGDLNYRLDGLPGEDIRRLLHLHARGEYGAESDAPLDGESLLIVKSPSTNDDTPEVSSEEGSETMRDPDDFPEDPSMDPTSLQATLDSLLPHEQLRRIIAQRKAFHDGWREGPITFLPTYKYDVGTVGLFDSSEKQRAPSWCDRILYRTRRDKEEFERKVGEEKIARERDEEMESRGVGEDEDVLFTYDPDLDGETPPAEATFEYDEYNDNESAETSKEEDPIFLEKYTSHQRISSSDHKPISSIFSITYPAIIPSLKAKVHAEVARELDRAENEGRPGITIVTETPSGVEFGDMQFLQRKVAGVTIANTGGVSATFSFVEQGKQEWLGTAFKRADGEEGDLGESVTLEPGETIIANITACIHSIPHLQSLNMGKTTLSEILILRIEDGRDHFIPTSATLLPTSLGRSISELIRIPDGGIHAFTRAHAITGPIPDSFEQRFSAPKELFKITTAMESLAERCVADEAMLEDVSLPSDLGWPLIKGTWVGEREDREGLCGCLIRALDEDKPLLAALPIETTSTLKLEALSSLLLLFLTSLTDGLIPPHLQTTLLTLPSPSKSQILDTLSTAPNHNIAFVFLTSALARIAAELSPPTSVQKRMSFRRVNARRGRESRFAEVLAGVVLKGGRGVFEVCIRGEDC